ncbi:transmembrane protein, putative (macronuclear) [Tetrahymena thermophila SB210]|uniref:Transmembrane protein, putative n=1 Tax=Tetrahymena thermophila (strain SB210) TaxID=312017 RepID=W7X5W8_TETTS|nr:transmembrane protein, putative [Tetrahymena thermophila SB210]EWS74760.1 transmembrane protein, putative [Tetrahymena thermophila SB210]|eukprot:XP_012652761.1 transmembrane protein, putative [Tetrahymena thermophila SB210]
MEISTALSLYNSFCYIFYILHRRVVEKYFYIKIMKKYGLKLSNMELVFLLQQYSMINQTICLKLVQLIIRLVRYQKYTMKMILNYLLDRLQLLITSMTLNNKVILRNIKIRYSNKAYQLLMKEKNIIQKIQLQIFLSNILFIQRQIKLKKGKIKILLNNKQVKNLIYSKNIAIKKKQLQMEFIKKTMKKRKSFFRQKLLFTKIKLIMIVALSLMKNQITKKLRVQNLSKSILRKIFFRFAQALVFIYFFIFVNSKKIFFTIVHNILIQQYQT